jgi:hypothetical protein
VRTASRKVFGISNRCNPPVRRIGMLAFVILGIPFPDPQQWLRHAYWCGTRSSTNRTVSFSAICRKRVPPNTSSRADASVTSQAAWSERQCESHSCIFSNETFDDVFRGKISVSPSLLKYVSRLDWSTDYTVSHRHLSESFTYGSSAISRALVGPLCRLFRPARQERRGGHSIRRTIPLES